MSLRSAIRRFFAAGNIENPAVPLTSANLLEWLIGPPSDSGVVVNKLSALQSTAVYRCLALVAGTVAALPLAVMKRLPQGHELANSHYLFPVLHDEPSELMTAFTWRESSMAHLLMQGNAYSAIEWTGAGRVASLILLQPEMVQPERVDGRTKYRVSLVDGGQEIIDQADMIHVPGLGYDGIKGISVIQYALRNPAGLSIALDRTMSRTSLNGLRPSGVIEAPKGMAADAIERIKNTVVALHSGSDKAGTPLFLDNGMSWKASQISPADAELLANRKFEVDEIGRIFGVPPHMIGQVERGTSWGTGMEQMTIGFVQFSLMQWLRRIEQELNRKLFFGSPYFCKHMLDELLRGDTKTRGDFYSQMIQNGVMKPNECRSFEGLAPDPDGDRLFIASNLQPISMAGTQPATPGAPAAPSKKPATPTPEPVEEEVP